MGLGAILAQGEGKAERPIIFISRKLSDREQRYATLEKEALAIKLPLDYLRYYLLGRRFALVTDHAPLTWMAGKRNNNNRIARWGHTPSWEWPPRIRMTTHRELSMDGSLRR